MQENSKLILDFNLLKQIMFICVLFQILFASFIKMSNRKIENVIEAKVVKAKIKLNAGLHTF